MQINPKDQHCWDIVKGDGYAIFSVFREAKLAGVIEDSLYRYPETSKREKLYLVKLKAK